MKANSEELEKANKQKMVELTNNINCDILIDESTIPSTALNRLAEIKK